MPEPITVVRKDPSVGLCKKVCMDCTFSLHKSGARPERVARLWDDMEELSEPVCFENFLYHRLAKAADVMCGEKPKVIEYDVPPEFCPNIQEHIDASK